jgi:putative ATP-dependent endonuclease of OLD family
MRLVRVRIENFRGYREAVDLRVGDLTALIGRNDVGKSTIMEALAGFFECESVKIEAGDVNVRARDAGCAVSCHFTDFPSELVLDAQAVTTLEAEHLLSAEGELVITKRWEFASRAKCTVYATALHPTAPHAADLLQLKQSELKKRASDLGLDLRAMGVDLRSNVQLRDALRRSVDDLKLSTVEVPLQSADDGKRIWEEIQRHMPTFALFRADRASRDDDPEVADPMRFAVQEAIRSVSDQLDAIRLAVQTQAVDVAHRTLAMLCEMDPDLASQLTPTFKAEPKYDGFKLSLTGDEDIPINKRGSGVRRLILLNFFRAEVERAREASSKRAVIYAVEEPEASLHPDKQRMLIAALGAMSELDQTQVLLTTHSPGLASELPIESIRFVRSDESGHPRVLEGEAILPAVAETLGVTPDPSRALRVLVYTEGVHDVNFLRSMSRVLREADPSVVCLTTDPRIGFVITGGDSLRHWIDGKFLQGRGLAEVHIYDRDMASQYQPWIEQVNQRERCWGTLTSKRTLENYLHPSAIQEVFDVLVEFTDDCNVPELVAVALSRGAKGAKRVKRQLNVDAASRMSVERLQESDPSGEIRRWLAKIGELVAL